VPKDGNGNALPFDIVLAACHNDTADSNAGYTPTVLSTEATRVINLLKAAYRQQRST
jgi:hypothetical protein